MKPATLKQLMRHDTIQTTEDFYIDLDVDEIAAELWREHSAGIDTFVDTTPEPPPTGTAPESGSDSETFDDART